MHVQQDILVVTGFKTRMHVDRSSVHHQGLKQCSLAACCFYSMYSLFTINTGCVIDTDVSTGYMS